MEFLTSLVSLSNPATQKQNDHQLPPKPSGHLGGLEGGELLREMGGSEVQGRRTWFFGLRG